MVKKLDRVLLVDDDSITNFINENLLRSSGFAEEIIVKSSAKASIDYLINDCKETNKYPDLIILDLKMPGMDGFEFLKEFEKLTQDLETNIVVVILTTSRNADDIIKLRGLGNYFLISKPLTKDKFVDIHHRYFRGSSSNYLEIA